MPILLIVLVLNVVLAFIAAGMASRRGQSAGLWFFLTIVFGLLAILFLAISPSTPSASTAGVSGGLVASHPSSGERDPGSQNTERWKVLKAVDSEVAEAAKTVAEVDPQLEARLAEKYFLINDKAYLAKLTQAVIVEHQEKLEQDRKDLVQARSKLDLEIRSEIEAFESILLPGGVDPISKEPVVAINQYFGRLVDFSGGIAVTLQGGKVLLKKGERSRVFNSNDPSLY